MMPLMSSADFFELPALFRIHDRAYICGIGKTFCCLNLVGKTQLRTMLDEIITRLTLGGPWEA